MNDRLPPDYYAVLQVSPHADGDTVERVFRHLAKRYHPDNGESGDSGRFNQVVEAFRVLSDPERRSDYDIHYGEVQQARWRVFDQASASDGVRSDRQLRTGILSVLYTARRNDVDRPGMGIIEMEKLLGAPEEHMKFHLWYLKERGWIQRLDNGTLAITATGVDEVMNGGGPDALPLLRAGSAGPAGPAGAGEPAGPAAPDGGADA
jgi:hypothetical protein